jgi:nucleotide-binding universal stress UspA family protein
MQFQKIVAAVDPTPAGMHALRTAALLAEAARAELVALWVVSDPWQGVRPDEVEPLRKRTGTAPADVAEARFGAELQRTVAATIGSARAEPVVRFGQPGTELARWAGFAKADLLVLGRQPLGRFERRPAGRILAETLQRASVPCLAVPFGQRSWGGVVAALGSEPAADAVLVVATTFAALWGERPVAIRIVAAPAEVAPAIDPASADPTEGEAVSQVLRVVREQQHNVVVVDARYGERFVERAPCAVLTVPRTRDLL